MHLALVRIPAHLASPLCLLLTLLPCSNLPASSCCTCSPPKQGLSHCYVKNQDGKLQDQYVIEPITANSLECMAVGQSSC